MLDDRYDSLVEHIAVITNWIELQVVLFMCAPSRV